MSDATPQIPPIPSAPIAGPDGRVTREWWRWFHLVFKVAEAQQTVINVIVTGMPGIPADEGLTIEQATLATLARLVPPDSISDPILAALLSQLLRVPPDPVLPEQAALLAQTVSFPPDPVSGDQISFQTLMMGVPA